MQPASSRERAGSHGRVERADGSVIEGLYAVGECSARAAAGVGCNSGYSLSRAMAFGFLAANEIADVVAPRWPQPAADADCARGVGRIRIASTGRSS